MAEYNSNEDLNTKLGMIDLSVEGNTLIETSKDEESIPQTFDTSASSDCDVNLNIKDSDNVRDSDSNKNILEQSTDILQAHSSNRNALEKMHGGITEFVQVNKEIEKNREDNGKEDDSNTRALMEGDPIASDSLELLNSKDREGADEDLCIISDTQREVSQAEKDAASEMPHLRDFASECEKESETTANEHAVNVPIIICKYEKEDLYICDECELKRKVKYNYVANEVTKYLCDDNCFNIFKNRQEEKVLLNWEEGSFRVKNVSGATKEPLSLSFIRTCASCKKRTCDIENILTWEIMDFCNEFCLSSYQKEIGSHCSNCQGEVKSNSLGKYCVRFGNDMRQFCTSLCLEKYKNRLKVCSYCQQDMSGTPKEFLAPVGNKGQFNDFCSQICMEKYDVMTMTNDCPPKVDPDTKCLVCKAEKPITIEFEFNESLNYFCSERCFITFSFVNNLSTGKCAMCRRHFPKSVLEKHTMYCDNVRHSFCSNSCKNIYIIAHRKIVPCSWCKVKKYNFEMIKRYSKSGPMINMCSVNCLNLYQVSINAVDRKTVCNFCQKLTLPMYHLTMSDATIRNFCSFSCFKNFHNQFSKQPITLNNLGGFGLPVPTGAPKKNEKHPGTEIVSVAAEVASTLSIISSLQSLASSNGNIEHTVGITPRLTSINTRSTRSKTTTNSTQIINPTPQTRNTTPQITNSLTDLPVQVKINQHFIVRPAPIPKQRNVGTMRSTRKARKSTTIKPVMLNKEVQTDEREGSKFLIPVPVPIYVPTPMHMYTVPVPVPIPFPISVPVPIFIPTTRNSAAGIMKEIKEIQEKISTDPYEAELLMMAEMVAEEKKDDPTDSESDVDEAGGSEDNYSLEAIDPSNTLGDDMLQMAYEMAAELYVGGPVDNFNPEPVDPSNTFGDNMLQMAYKMTAELDVSGPVDNFNPEPVDPNNIFGDNMLQMAYKMAAELDVCGPEDSPSLEPVDPSNTFGDDILQIVLKMDTELDELAVDLEDPLTANTITAPQGVEIHGADENVNDAQSGHSIIERPASMGGRKRGIRQSKGGAKRRRGISRQQAKIPFLQQPAPPPEPIVQPDANKRLKYTFGVNAWKQWMTAKNAKLEKSSNCPMLFKTEILQLTSDQLNYTLCLFVKEVRKPNGAEYAPDTLYYLCLGIQQYLFENGRIDNIFCDPYYEKFTDCLDEVAKKFSVFYNDSHYIATRVEEEHLWESKQLGAHSPHVLLSTLMFFNAKYFNLMTVDEHMQLSFAQILVYWKKKFWLRFYPQQSAIQNNARKKQFYEQEQNKENPLRCPVKLYELYLSKRPESTKTCCDLFYLQPETSCAPDSPFWYCAMPLRREALEKMLHRVKLVKEINVALLTS